MPGGALRVPLLTVVLREVPLDLTKCAIDAPTLGALARERGVLVSVLGPRVGRLLTHLDVDDAGIDRAIEVLTDLLT